MAIYPDVLRQARLDAGLSLAQVAGSELTRQAVHLVETGKVRPRKETLQFIARRLGIPVASVLVESESRLPDARAQEMERLCERQRYTDVCDLAEALLRSPEVPDAEAIARYYLGRALNHLLRPDEALVHLQRARELFQEAADPWLAADSLHWEAAAWYLKEDPRAAAMGEEALRRYRALNPRRPETEALMLEHLATFLVRRREFQRARALYAEALQVAGTVRDIGRLGHVYHGLSRCEAAAGDLRRAVELGEKAVALHAVEDDLRPVPARVDLARAEGDLGVLCLRLGQLDRAEECFRSALARLTAAGAERLVTPGLLTMARLRQKQGRLEEAMSFVSQAIALAGRLGEVITLAQAHRQLGELHGALGEHDLADAAFQRALDILADAGLEQRRADCLAAYGAVLEARGGAAGGRSAASGDGG